MTSPARVPLLALGAIAASLPAGGGIAITDAGTDPQSPAYQHAQTICGGR